MPVSSIESTTPVSKHGFVRLKPKQINKKKVLFYKEQYGANEIR